MRIRTPGNFIYTVRPITQPVQHSALLTEIEIAYDYALLLANGKTYENTFVAGSYSTLILKLVRYTFYSNLSLKNTSSMVATYQRAVPVTNNSISSSMLNSSLQLVQYSNEYTKPDYNADLQ